jgi:hypothetical protein
MQWVIVLALVSGVLVWAWRAERGAEIDARSFCADVAIGSPIADVAHAARTAGDDRLRRIGEQSITVGYTGIPPFSRHLCDIRAGNGKVAAKKYVYLD